MIERVVYAIRQRQEELREEPFRAMAPNPELFARNYWRAQGLEDALELINNILKKDAEDGN